MIGPLAQPNFPCGQRGCRAAGRAARIERGVPRVSRLSKDIIECIAACAEFGRVGFAQNHCPVPFQLIHQRITFLRYKCRQPFGSEGCADIGDGVEVFDRDRQARQPTGRGVVLV